MFGSSKPAFSFGSSQQASNTQSNGSGFSFGAQNNQNKPSGFSLNTNNAPAPPKPAGFSFGGNTSSLGTSQAAKPSDFSFGSSSTQNSQAPAQSLNFGAPKPNIFGNSQTTGQTTTSALSSSLQMPQMQQQQQQQHQLPQNPYGSTLNMSTTTEMPASLTSKSEPKLKRKRSVSSVTSSSTSASAPSGGDAPRSNRMMFLGSLGQSFTKPTHKTESVSGLFSSSRSIIDGQQKQASDAAAAPQDSINAYTNLHNVQVPKSDYRRLIIRHSRDAFKNYSEIDPNQVLLKDVVIKAPAHRTRAVSDFRPPTKKARLDEKEKKSNNKNNNKSAEAGEAGQSTAASVPDLEQSRAESETAKAQGYWCSPPIEELVKLPSEKLLAVDFTVGRRGCGQVRFNLPVDLTAFENNWDELLGDTVVFKGKTLQVYPDEEKPSIGNGMNVPATITIEGCFPRDKATKTPIKDPEAPEMSLFSSQLKDKPGMSFVNYDPITGSYTFIVQHFSIWGLVDEDEDDEETVEKYRKQQEAERELQARRQVLNERAANNIATYENGTLTKMYLGNGSQDRSNKLPLGSIPGNWNGNSGDRVASGISSSSTAAADAAATPAQDVIVADGEDSAFVEDGEIEEEDEIVEDDLEAMDDVVHVRAYEPDPEDVDMFALKPTGDYPVAAEWDKQLKLSSGVDSVFNAKLTKMTSQPLTAKNINNLIFKKPAPTSRALSPQKPAFALSSQYQQCLDLEIQQSQFVQRPNGFPKVAFDTEVSLTSTLKSFKGTAQYEAYHLLAILFDDNYILAHLSSLDTQAYTDKPEMKSRLLELKRRDLLSSWVHRLCADSLRRVIGSSQKLDNVFYLMCSNRLGDAARTAIASGSSHIGVLISESDSNDATVRSLAASQLEEWSRSSTLGLIPRPVLKIYKLLSGSILSNKYIGHLDGLSWPVVLFLLLKFGDTNVPLSDTLKQFVGYVTDPQGVDEVYYNLFKLFTSHEGLETFEVEFAFLLITKLNTLLQLPVGVTDGICKEFSAKLSQYGMYTESLFVSEYLSDDNACKEEIVLLLNSHIDELGYLQDDAKLQRLHKSLGLPLNVLNETRATKFTSAEKYEPAARSLIDANELTKAEELTLSKVAPGYVIGNYKLEKCEWLLGNFKLLSDYHVGAGLYSEYFKLLKMDESNVEEMSAIVKDLLNNLPAMKETNKQSKVARTIMYKKIIGMIFRYRLPYTESQLLSLDMPPSEMNYLKNKLPQKMAIGE